jgi:hypothetical protein
MNRFTIFSLSLGAALIDAGVAWIYRPLGLIVAGAFLLAAGILSVKVKS